MANLRMVDPDNLPTLEALEDKCGCDQTMLVNSGLMLLAWCVEQIEKGYNISAVDEINRITYEIRIPLFDHVVKKIHLSGATIEPLAPLAEIQ